MSIAPVELLRFDTDAELVQRFIERLCKQLSQAIAARGKAYLVVSGGRTPIKLFSELSHQPLDWARVTITLADERWVAADDAASNECLVKQHLLQNRAAAATFVSLLEPTAGPVASASAAESKLAQLPTFDVVILGMGEDGHTASLFPCSAELEQGLTTAAAALVVRPTTAPHQRISMSLRRLLDSRQIYFHLSGAAKADVLARALKDTNHHAMPVRAVLHQTQVPVSVLLAG